MSSNGPSDSLEDCSVTASTHATIVSCRVPFKWEESPGKPSPAIATTMSSCNNNNDVISLQLPPKLQCQGHQTPLFLHQSCPLPLHPNHQNLKRLCKYMLKTASWSQPPTHLPQSWSTSACAITNDRLDDHPLNERFFFDRAIPKEFKYSVSMDSSLKAQLPIHEKYKRRDAFVSGEALTFLPVEEHEAESSASSPLQPIMFHERDGSASSWQPTSIKASKELGGRDDDDNDDDLFSTASSSLDKPSQRTDESMVSSCPSPSPWFLDFGPKEHEIHEERGGSKLVVRLVAIIKLKNIISSKVCKLRTRREGANQQANNTSMWSPTLATYLFNEQKEERRSRSPSLHDHLLASEDNDHLLASENRDDDDHLLASDNRDDDDDDELPSSSSAASSDRFYINPDYHLPTSILRGHLHSNNDISESPGSSSFRVHQLGLERSPCFSEEEDEHEHEDEDEAMEGEPHRLSLREQLTEFDDEYPIQFVPTQSTAPRILDSQKREPTPSKGQCKVLKTVKVIAATIKLIFVQIEVRKRKEQTPSLKYGSCLKPNLGTLTPLPSTHK